jgi:capsular polysaccharide biosynthesis protein
LVDPPGSAPPYYSETLRLILGPEFASRSRVIRGNVRTRRTMLTQRDPFTGRSHPDDIQLLNRSFLRKPVCEPVSRRLYVSRRKASARRIRNEDKVEAMLIAKGYQVVFLEDFSLQEQIQLTAQCDFLVSPHGAGLSHLAWNPSRKKAVFEIFPSHVTNDTFASLACMLGYDYGYLRCKNEPGGETCDLSKLVTGLKEMGMV